MLVTGKKTLQGKFNGAITEIGKSPKSFSRVDGKYLQYSSNVGLARAYPCSMELAINQLKICNLLASRPDLVCMITIGDRKSTRLNSSHVAISYAVFCSKTKKK